MSYEGHFEDNYEEQSNVPKPTALVMEVFRFEAL